MGSITIKDIPDDLVAVINLYARARNCSPEEVVGSIIERAFTDIDVHEWLDLVAQTPSVRITSEEIVAIVRDERESR